MKKIELLLAILTTVVIRSTGQTDVVKYYCQGCCGCINVYYLKLDTNSEFELYYWTRYNKKESSTFGLGKFNKDNDILTLFFDDIPQDGVESKKINISDSLIIQFSVFDNIRGDSIAMINVKRKYGETLFYPTSTGTIKIRFNGLEKINFSSFGFNDITHSISEPGRYELRVRLNPEGSNYLKKGDKKKFKIIKTNTLEWFKEIGEQKLKFTPKSCGC